MSSLTKSIAMNTLAQLVGKILSVVCSLGATILLTRYLGPEKFGSYSLIIVFVTLFSGVADWGLSLITVRDASRDISNESLIISQSMIIRLCFSIFALILCVSAVVFLPYSTEIKNLIPPASLILIFLSLKTSMQIVFNVRLKLNYTALSDLFASVLMLVFIIFMIYLRQDLQFLIFSAVITHGIAALLTWFLVKNIFTFHLVWNQEIIKKLLLESLPMGGILILFSVYNRVDTIIISLYKGQGDVGIYATSYKVYEVLVLGAAYFANSILPLLSQFSANKEKFIRIFKRAFVVLLCCGVFISLGNLFFASLAIKIIAGNNYLDAVLPLQILSLALFVSYFNHLNGYCLVALGRQKESLKIAILALILNFSLNIIFIPYFSYNAAAVITFVTEFMIVLISWKVISKEINMTFSPSEFKNLLVEFITNKGQFFRI